MDIYVGNLPYDTEESVLRSAFEEYGAVDNVKMIVDHETGRSKGFAFVSMSDQEAGKKAIEELDGGDLNGRAIKVKEARPREERPRRDFNSGGGNGGGFRGGNRGGGHGGGPRQSRGGFDRRRSGGGGGGGYGGGRRRDDSSRGGDPDWR